MLQAMMIDYDADTASTALATVLGKPLVHEPDRLLPSWPDGEPEVHQFDRNGNIRIDAVCDVVIHWGERLYKCACGHRVVPRGIYLRWLTPGLVTTCLPCSEQVDLHHDAPCFAALDRIGCDACEEDHPC